MHACWEERKFQREQVGVAIAIYQDDFDLLHASVTAAEKLPMNQDSLQSIIMCVHTKMSPPNGSTFNLKTMVNQLRFFLKNVLTIIA